MELELLLAQNPEEAQQARGNLLNFIVRQYLAEFFLINGLELFDSLAAQLLWWFHVVHLIGASLQGKEGLSCQKWQVRFPIILTKVIKYVAV